MFRYRTIPADSFEPARYVLGQSVGRGFHRLVVERNARRLYCVTRCTVLYGTPTMYIDLLKAVAEFSSELIVTPEIGLCGGALCSPSLLKQIKATFNLRRVVVT